MSSEPLQRPELPATLAPWADALAPLDGEVARALGPMLHILDSLVGRLDDRRGDAGELDGFDGTINRGDPERLLLSEWALADEVPLEFLRRAADTELTYLRRSYKLTPARGRVVVACDVGPDQVGPGRLVQLAAIVVLAQRARNSGAELELRIIQSGERSIEPLSGLLPRWLRARSTTVATPEHFAAAFEDVEAEDRLWLLLGTASAAPPGHRRTVLSRISGWNGNGAAEMSVHVGDSSVHLVLPSGPAAVAALRGDGLLARQSRSARARVSGSVGGARFNSADARLLWRGELEDEVRSCRADANGAAPKVGTHRAPGAVLAGAYLGKRLVLAVSDGSRVRIHVIGKRLSSVHAIDVLHGDIGLDQDEVARLLAGPLPPLYLMGGNILLAIHGKWWVLTPDGAWLENHHDFAPGRALDSPRRVHNTSSGLWIDHRRIVESEVARVVLGPVDAHDSWHARTLDSRVWTVSNDSGEKVTEIGIPEGETVLGLMLLPRPSLVTVSSGGILVRHFTEQDTYTWTRWSGPGEYSVHPTRPWLVRTTEEGITVGDLYLKQPLLELRLDR